MRFKNGIDRPATIHWHGVRLQNAYDGSPQMTQPPVPPGGAFLYAVHCPDAGIFWYHDHAREDIGQPLGLFGNLYVEAEHPTAGVQPRQAFLMLSDILVDGDSLMPFGRDEPNFSLMGRFGNVIMVNGESQWRFTAAAGDVVRFLLTNAASARAFNVSFGDAPMKLIASDQGPYAREVSVSSITIAPGERYVVNVRFERAGDVPLLNQVQTVDHFLGEIYPNRDTLGHVTVTGEARTGADPAFTTMHDDSAMLRDIERLKPAFSKLPDEEIVLTTAIQGLPIPVMQINVCRQRLPSARRVHRRDVGHELAVDGQGSPLDHPGARGLAPKTCTLHGTSMSATSSRSECTTIHGHFTQWITHCTCTGNAFSRSRETAWPIHTSSGKTPALFPLGRLWTCWSS